MKNIEYFLKKISSVKGLLFGADIILLVDYTILSHNLVSFLIKLAFSMLKIILVNNPVPVSLLSGDRKPQIRFLGNHPSGSGNLYHKSFRM